MAPSRPIWINPVVEAAAEMEKYIGTADMIEKLFLRSFSKEKVDTSEFENTDLHRYYHARLEQTPREAGQFWLRHMNSTIFEDPCVQILCKFRVPLDYYKIMGSKGPLVTSRGEMEENHIKLWMTKLEKKFIVQNNRDGARKLDTNKIIRDFYELSVILNRTVTEASVTLKMKILNSLIRRLNAVDVFLLKEVCAANSRHGHRNSPFKNQKATYEMAVFVLTAELMFKRLRNKVAEHVPQRRPGSTDQLEDEDEELYAYAIQGGFALTANPTLTTSESPSSSSQEVDNVVTYHH